MDYRKGYSGVEKNIARHCSHINFIFKQRKPTFHERKNFIYFPRTKFKKKKNQTFLKMILNQKRINSKLTTNKIILISKFHSGLKTLWRISKSRQGKAYDKAADLISAGITKF